MSDNLFYMVMEADGDELQPFDDGGSVEAPTEDVNPPATDDMNDSSGDLDSPPPLSEDGDMDLSSTSSDDDMSMGDTDDMSGESNDESQEADKKDTTLSDKANNILNQQLYQKMVARNNEIEEILNNIKDIVPLLPYDVVKSNDDSVSHLKSALMKGQKYVINDFVDSGYGENLLFYQKLDSLYVLLLNQIDRNLKKIKKQ